MKTKTGDRLLLWWNIAIVALAVFALYIMAFWDHADALLSSQGVGNLKYFTVLSNVFEGIMSLILAVRLLRVRRSRAEGVPHALYLLKLLAAVTVTVTFMVVAVLLLTMTHRSICLVDMSLVTIRMKQVVVSILATIHKMVLQS